MFPMGELQAIAVPLGPPMRCARLYLHKARPVDQLNIAGNPVQTYRLEDLLELVVISLGSAGGRCLVLVVLRGGGPGVNR